MVCRNVNPVHLGDVVTSKALLEVYPWVSSEVSSVRFVARDNASLITIQSARFKGLLLTSCEPEGVRGRCLSRPGS